MLVGASLPFFFSGIIALCFIASSCLEDPRGPLEERNPTAP